MSKKKTTETIEETPVTKSITMTRKVLYKDTLYMNGETYEVTQEVYDVLCKYSVACANWDCKCSK